MIFFYLLKMSSDKVLYACLTKHPAQKISLTALGTGRPVPEVRAAFLNRIQWPQKSEIRVCFLRKPFDNNGETLDPQYAPEKAAFVQMIVMKKLAPIVNLTFTWDVSQSSSNVRISFVKGLGAYSMLGTDALNFPKDLPTMNLGWLDNEDPDFPQARKTGAVVIHEFGHLLGLIHEHSRATSDTKFTWNKPFVINYMKQYPNNWNEQACEEQIFKAYDVNSYNGSVYDPSSIMHYFFEKNFFIPPTELSHATELSPLDIQVIQKKYPRAEGPVNPGDFKKPEDPGTTPGTTPATTPASSLQNSKVFYFLIFIAFIFLFILIIQ